MFQPPIPKRGYAFLSLKIYCLCRLLHLSKIILGNKCGNWDDEYLFAASDLENTGGDIFFFNQFINVFLMQ